MRTCLKDIAPLANSPVSVCMFFNHCLNNGDSIAFLQENRHHTRSNTILRKLWAFNIKMLPFLKIFHNPDYKCLLDKLCNQKQEGKKRRKGRETGETFKQPILSQAIPRKMLPFFPKFLKNLQKPHYKCHIEHEKLECWKGNITEQLGVLPNNSLKPNTKAIPRNCFILNINACFFPKNCERTSRSPYEDELCNLHAKRRTPQEERTI